MSYSIKHFTYFQGQYVFDYCLSSPRITMTMVYKQKKCTDSQIYLWPKNKGDAFPYSCLKRDQAIAVKEFLPYLAD